MNPLAVGARARIFTHMTRMAAPHLLRLSSPDATETLARSLGAMLSPGDVILLHGDIGAGKTHFARALIQSLQDPPEDVPSPTFTLVQTYDTQKGDLWHADLYRLTSPDECVELGLADAFDTAICLIEWPDRLEDLVPEDSLHLRFSMADDDEDARLLDISGNNTRWADALAPLLPHGHESVVDAFLTEAGWGDATQAPLAGDASGRKYTRLSQNGDTAILMEDPEGGTARFVRIARYLQGAGLSAPKVYAETPNHLLLEDFGDGHMARLAVDAESEARLYRTAVDALVALHTRPAPKGLPVATPAHLADAIDLVFVHYAHVPELFEPARAAFLPILETHAAPEDVVVLRDYHAENIMVLPGRTGAARAGLLDFQDALVGHSAYDLVSLCRDPRRDLAPTTEEQCIAAYLSATGDAADTFRTAYAVLGVQRNLRILGIFARLAAQRGKPHYLDYLPRTWSHLQTQLAHPALAALRPVLADLPAPDDTHMDRLLDLCPTP